MKNLFWTLSLVLVSGASFANDHHMKAVNVTKACATEIAASCATEKGKKQIDCLSKQDVTKFSADCKTAFDAAMKKTENMKK